MAKVLRDMNSNLISSLGLEDWFRIPVANDANKILEEKYLELQKAKTSSEAELNEESDRVKDIENHLRNVKNEITFIQMLLLAKGKEVDDESNLALVKARECGKIEKEIAQLNKQLQDLKEKENNFENSVFKLNRQVEEKKQQMDWDQQTLENWLDECRRRDDNLAFLEKYSRQDESKIKELSMKIANLTEECLAFRKKIDQETVETQAAQYGLEKIAGDYRKSHAERRELVQRWQQTLEQLQKKDEEMDELSLRITEKKREVALKEADAGEAEDFLASEVKANEDADARIKMAEGSQARRRKFLLELEKARLDAIGELQTIKLELERTASDLESSRGQVKATKQDIAVKKAKLTSVSKQLEELREREKALARDVVGAEGRTRRVEEAVEEEERMQRKLEEEIKGLDVQLYRRQRAVKQLSVKKKNLEGDIQSSQVAIKNLTLKAEKMELEIAKQTKLLYNQDYRLLGLNKKLSKMQGEVATEEENLQVDLIARLNDELEKHKKTLQFTNGQHLRLNEDIKKLRQECDRLKDSGGEHSKKARELELKIDLTRKALKDLVGQKQDKLVYENLKKLELKRLRDLLFRRADENASVERDLAVVSAAMEERREEIAKHRSLLVAEIRAAEERLRKVNAEVQERKAKVEQLKNRYDIISMKMMPNEGEGSIAGYLIRATQEVEELKLRGDLLNKSIQTKERELEAFDNTVLLVAGKNELQRRAILGGSVTIEPDPKQEESENKLRTKLQELKTKKRSCESYANDNEELGSRLQSTEEEISYAEEDANSRKLKLAKLKKELNDQVTKLERVTKMNLKLSKELMAMKKGDLTDEEMDISVRELRELNDMVAREINATLGEHPSLCVALQEHFERANVQWSPVGASLPANRSRPPSLPSSRSSQGLPARVSLDRGRGTVSSKTHSVSLSIKDVVQQFPDDHLPSPAPKSNKSNPPSRMSLKSNDQRSRPASTSSGHSSVRSRSSRK